MEENERDLGKIWGKMVKRAPGRGVRGVAWAQLVSGCWQGGDMKGKGWGECPGAPRTCRGAGCPGSFFF